MQDDLIESERLIGAILSKLSRSGVKRVSLSAQEFGVDRHFLQDAVIWLSREKLIKADGGHFDGYLQCALTAKGFSLLGQTFRIDGGEVHLVEAVRRVGSGEESYAKAGNFFGGLLGAFTKSVGG